MSSTITLAGYIAILVVAAGYEVVGRVSGRTPTLAVTLRIVLRHRAGRLVLLAWWMWVGWHVFVRSHH